MEMQAGPLLQRVEDIPSILQFEEKISLLIQFQADKNRYNFYSIK
jgi:hypothetical protein